MTDTEILGNVARLLLVHKRFVDDEYDAGLYLFARALQRIIEGDQFEVVIAEAVGD